MEQFHLQVNEITSYTLAFDSNDCVLVVLNNVNEACQHDYSRDFSETLRAIHQQYKYDHKHDSTSLTDILQLLTLVDSLCDPADAPEPETANAVTDSMTLFSDFVNGMDIEVGVSGSDSNSTCEKKKTACNNCDCGRDNNR
jgi:hypothetical protein